MDLNAPVQAAQANKVERQNLIGGFQNQNNDFYSRYRNEINSQGTTGQAAEQIGNQLGLPALRQNAFQLQQAVQRAPQLAQDTTRGFDVTNSQLQNVIASKLAKLSPLAQQATAQQQNAENSLNTQLGYTQNDWQRQLQPTQLEGSQMPGMQSLVLSGYNQGAADELSALVSKMNAGITLSEGEKNRANQLAIAEMTHKENMDKQNALNAQNAFTNAQPSYSSVSKDSLIFDQRTGKFINPPKAASSGSNVFSYLNAQPTPSFRPKG